MQAAKQFLCANIKKS